MIFQRIKSRSKDRLVGGAGVLSRLNIVVTYFFNGLQTHPDQSGVKKCLGDKSPYMLAHEKP